MLTLLPVLVLFGDMNPPVVRHDPPSVRAQDGSVYLWFEVSDSSPLFGQAVFVRSTGSRRWERAELTEVAPGWFQARLRLSGAFEYFFEVFDEQGNGPSRVGTPQAPFRAPVAIGKLPDRRPWVPPPKVVAPPPPEEDPPTVVTAFQDLWSIPKVRRNTLYTTAGMLAVGVTYGTWRMVRSPGGKGQVVLVPVSP